MSNNWIRDFFGIEIFKMKNNKFNYEIEYKVWDLIRKMEPESRIKPINISTEREIFFDEINKNKIYNPQFKYNEKNNEKYVIELLNVKKNINSEFADDYEKLIEHAVTWDKRLELRNVDSDKWLYDIHGKPSSEAVTQAKKRITEIQTQKVKNSVTNLNSDYARDFFEKTLGTYGYDNWKIDIISMPAKVSIDSLSKRVLINIDSLFSSSELKRLAVHEIGTHILRNENGIFQSDPIFQHGFINYIETEEGLAIFSEHVTGNLSAEDLKKYCLRVLACDLAMNNSFHDVYTHLLDYTSKDQAFSITMRVKRGLRDTSKNYGYSKDQVYLSGFLKVKELSDLNRKKLYCGKIGFSELGSIDFSKIDTKEIKIPSWVN